jgi:hypothetical protein
VVNRQAAPVPSFRSAADPRVRVLRWRFRRDDEIVIAELALTQDESAYELTLRPPWNLTGVSSEVFDDVVGAFQRHAALERQLLNEGFSLERFESDRVNRRV